MTRAMAVELDRVGLVGSGSSPEPRGITNTSGRGMVTGVGAVTNYAPLLRGVRTLLEANMPIEIAAANAIMSPAAWYTHESLATGISGDKTDLPRPPALKNTTFRVTTNGLDTDNSPQTSTVVMGDFRDLVLGVRREASVEVLKATTYATNLLLEFVAYLRADYMVRRPSSFVTIEGIGVS
jgi:HK97 family phage major capsid protein